MQLDFNADDDDERAPVTAGTRALTPTASLFVPRTPTEEGDDYDDNDDRAPVTTLRYSNS